MSDAVSGVGEADYMKIFMQELTYQDPLKPMDNKEFMAQMAQFSALQQAQQSTQYLGQLLGTTAGNQAIMLLGKSVQFADSKDRFNVYGVSFATNEEPKLSIRENGSTVLRKLSDVVEVGAGS